MLHVSCINASCAKCYEELETARAFDRLVNLSIELNNKIDEVGNFALVVKELKHILNEYMIFLEVGCKILARCNSDTKGHVLTMLLENGNICVYECRFIRRNGRWQELDE